MCCCFCRDRWDTNTPKRWKRLLISFFFLIISSDPGSSLKWVTTEINIQHNKASNEATNPHQPTFYFGRFLQYSWDASCSLASYTTWLANLRGRFKARSGWRCHGDDSVLFCLDVKDSLCASLPNGKPEKENQSQRFNETWNVLWLIVHKLIRML